MSSTAITMRVIETVVSQASCRMDVIRLEHSPYMKIAILRGRNATVSLCKPWETMPFLAVWLFSYRHAPLIVSNPFFTILDLQQSFCCPLYFNIRAHCPLLQCLHTTNAILAVHILILWYHLNARKKIVSMT